MCMSLLSVLVRSVSLVDILLFFFFKQKTAYEMRISDWSSDVCSSDLHAGRDRHRLRGGREEAERDARQAGRIHVMDPEPETEEAGADGGQQDPGIAVERTMREGRHDHRHHRYGGQEDDGELRVAEQPNKMRPRTDERGVGKERDRAGQE